MFLRQQVQQEFLALQEQLPVLQLQALLEGIQVQGRFNQNLHRIPEEDFPAEEEDYSIQAHHPEQ